MYKDRQIQKNFDLKILRFSHSSVQTQFRIARNNYYILCCDGYSDGTVICIVIYNRNAEKNHKYLKT